MQIYCPTYTIKCTRFPKIDSMYTMNVLHSTINAHAFHSASEISIEQSHKVANVSRSTHTQTKEKKTRYWVEYVNVFATSNCSSSHCQHILCVHSAYSRLSRMIFLLLIFSIDNEYAMYTHIEAKLHNFPYSLWNSIDSSTVRFAIFIFVAETSTRK